MVKQQHNRLFNLLIQSGVSAVSKLRQRCIFPVPVNFCPHQQMPSDDLLRYAAIISVPDLRAGERSDGGGCQRIRLGATAGAEGCAGFCAWPLQSAIRTSSSIFIDRSDWRSQATGGIKLQRSHAARAGGRLSNARDDQRGSSRQDESKERQSPGGRRLCGSPGAWEAHHASKCTSRN